MEIPEILAPAGSMEALETACLYGADAVYLGLKEGYSLRSDAKNFDMDELERAVTLAHSYGVKVYLTLNAYLHDDQLAALPDVIISAGDIGVDAFIISDIGVFSIAKELRPEIPVHISTQANTTNTRAINAWASLGVKRVILARELSSKEIANMRKNTDSELEIFVHGSICISISGRCLVSNYLCGRDANRGMCAQSCRWEYALVERKRKGEYMPVFEEDGFTFLYNSKDLCLMPVMDRVMELGLDGLKIEGRKKTILYVATTVSTYRKARDAWAKDSENFKVDPEWIEELKKITNRGYFLGFFEGQPSKDSIDCWFKDYTQTHHLAAKVLATQGDVTTFEARNPLIEGMELEWMSSCFKRRKFILNSANVDGFPSTYIKPNQIFTMKTPFRPKTGELIRKPFSQGDKVS